jgi:peptidoglycan hydrolase-like protein with peptidoglycan-binding domain
MVYAIQTDTLRVPKLEPVITGEAVIVRGARSQGVRAFQRALLTLGHGLRGGADGIFGPSTEAELAEFRALWDKKGDAILDASTLEALDRSLARHEAVADYQLSNLRHRDDPILAKVLAGRRSLPRRSEATKTVQESLHDLMFALPRWGADGVLGRETAEAVRRFQRWQKIRPGGYFTPLTLMALDQLAPPPGEQVVRSPDYAALIHEGWLTITIGMGYDEGEADLRELRELEHALDNEGFTRVGSVGGVASYTRALAMDDHQGSVRVRVVSRHSQDPEEAFAEGLIHDSVTIYSGHARYGTGPDFDIKSSPEENFVIGIGAPGHRTGQLEPGYNAHMNQILAGQPNDLLVRRFDPERYQLWAFAGCTTRNYLDELRALIDGKDTHNLDLVVSSRPLYWRDMATFAIELVRGIIRGASYNAVHERLCATAAATEALLGESHEGDAFIPDGFGDNG